MGFKITIQGDHEATNRFLKKLKEFQIRRVLEKYGQKGVSALASATPVRTGTTSRSWMYRIESNGDSHTIYWTNTNENRGVNIALILQYGHGTGRGGYVSGRDYINPAIQPIFDAIVEEAWKELSKI
jgi:hypothetical protein|nr:MAG TPA: type I neck protein [Caudoviricetes sp.]